MKQLKLHLGTLAPSIEEQLQEKGLTIKNIRKYEKLAFAITMLNVHRYLSDSETDKKRNKLIKEIASKVQPIEED